MAESSIIKMTHAAGRWLCHCSCHDPGETLPHQSSSARLTFWSWLAPVVARAPGISQGTGLQDEILSNPFQDSSLLQLRAAWAVPGLLLKLIHGLALNASQP